MSKDKAKVIIVRKGKRHAAHGHGGSWKVAYADFVTAMMAFFLLMWLLSMVKPETKAAVADYFEQYNLFTSQPGEFNSRATTKGTSPVDGSARPTPGHEVRWSVSEALSTREIKAKIEQALNLELGQERDRVILEEYKEGLRIHLVDKQGQPSFESGDPALTKEGLRALQAVEQAIRFVTNPIAIEGHTDAHPLSRDGQDNWSLSMARAERVRQNLLAWGFKFKHLVHVAGYANSAPLITIDPYDARNRRVSILIYNSNAALPVSTIGIGSGRIVQQPAGGSPEGPPAQTKPAEAAPEAGPPS